MYSFFFSSRRRHTRCALVTGVQTCALPISIARASATRIRRRIIISLLPCGGGAGSVAGIAIALSHQARIIGGQVRGSQRRQVRLSHLRALAQNFRSEEHTSELQSLMRISYAVFCLKTKTQHSRTQPSSRSAYAITFLTQKRL